MLYVKIGFSMEKISLKFNPILKIQLIFWDFGILDEVSHFVLSFSKILWI